ncbi:MAG: hypothetical protein IAE98_00165, partial [Candidatus Kapabacteria bacterium]|nr:hypothetical protein [Candidatus Kapabacteria bacterium]
MTKNFFILSSYMLLMLLPTINAQPIWEKVGFEIGDYKYIRCCLLYTSDAADDGESVDLG